MAEKTVSIDIDSYKPYEWIPILQENAPVSGYAATAVVLRHLIQFPQLKIYEAGTTKRITGNNYYDYFPESDGGGGVTPKEIDEINERIDEIEERLPSLDDAIEGYYDSSTNKFYSDSSKTKEIKGETGKIYVDITSGSDTENHIFRYTGSTFIDISNTITKDSLYTLMDVDTDTGNFIGTDGTSDGQHGFVPAPESTDDETFLRSDGTWSQAVQPTDNLEFTFVPDNT